MEIIFNKLKTQVCFVPCNGIMSSNFKSLLAAGHSLFEMYNNNTITFNEFAKAVETLNNSNLSGDKIALIYAETEKRTMTYLELVLCSCYKSAPHAHLKNEGETHPKKFFDKDTLYREIERLFKNHFITENCKNKINMDIASCSLKQN